MTDRETTRSRSRRFTIAGERALVAPSFPERALSLLRRLPRIYRSARRRQLPGPLRAVESR